MKDALTLVQVVFNYSILLILLFFIGQPNLSFAQKNAHEHINEEHFHGMKYRSVGPTRGGRVTAVEGIENKPFTFLMGATGGGVWKTDDAGNSWNNISDGQIKAGSIGAIAVAPSDPTIIYVGTGSACPRGNVSGGIGLYKSMDGGLNWTHIGLQKAGQIGKIIVHPTNPELVYVAVLGNIFGPNQERGVYRSKNGGGSWDLVHHVSNKTGAVDLSINPNNPREIYAAMWRAERKPWTLIDGGEEGGIWKSMDAGDTWTKLTGGLPTGLLGRIGVQVAPSNPEKVYAIIQSAKEEDGGVWRSEDSGKTWKRINRDHKLRQRGWYYSHLTVDPQDENTVYFNNVNFFKSIDGGKSLERIRVPHGDNHALWINPQNPKIMVHGNDGGACVSLNGGKTWSSEHNQPTSEFYRVTVDNQFPYRLYAGQQDNTTISVPSHSTIGTLTSTGDWLWAGGSECGDVAINPQNPDIVWGGSYSGEITILNRKTGQVRQVTAYPHYTEGTEMRNLKYRWQWNFPILVSAYNPNTVYHTSNYVHRTTDNGQTWEKISPDLTQPIDAYFGIPGGPIQHDATGVEVYSSIFAFEESPHQEGELWAGSDDGLVHISTDGGTNWTNVTPKGMPKEGTVNKIELSTHSPGRAFITVYNYRYADFKPYIFKTDNYGKTWMKITKGIADTHFVRAISEDPDRKNLLYAGTEFGMYVSFDGGQNWQSFQLNLPHVPITDMEVVQKDLVLSTQGRAFWILDDVSRLHTFDKNIFNKKSHLFKPRNTYRTNVGGISSKVDFYLKEMPDSVEVVDLEIIDGKGQTIRHFSTKTNEAKKIEPLKIKAGMNTFHWNLRHRGPEMVKNLVTMVIRNPSPGPRAIPGRYQIKLTANGEIQTADFQLLNDPRWTDISSEDYQAQLELGTALTDLITEAHQLIKNLRSIREQANHITKNAVKAGRAEVLTKSAADLDKKLSKVEDQIIQNKSEASQDNINFPRVFSNHIGRLYGVVVNAHDRPTGGALERYEDLKKEYAGIKKDYDKVISEELPVFTKLLEEHGVERIMIPK